MSSLSSWFIRVSLLLTTALVPASLADNIRSGTIWIYDSHNGLKGGLDKGANLGNTFKVIYNSNGGSYTGNEGIFSYVDRGPGTPFTILCEQCGVSQGKVVDLQVGTVLGEYKVAKAQTQVWFPIAVRTTVPGDTSLLHQRDLSESFLWTMDANNNLTPVLLDANGAPTKQVLHLDGDGCESKYSNANCNIWWGPPVPNAVDVSPMTLRFTQTKDATVFIPPADTSQAMCS